MYDGSAMVPLFLRGGMGLQADSLKDQYFTLLFSAKVHGFRKLKKWHEVNSKVPSLNSVSRREGRCLMNIKRKSGTM